MQQYEVARRTAQVVHPRYGLLPAVAALFQVHGTRLRDAADPTDLVRDGLDVGVDADTRSDRLHAQRLVRPCTRGYCTGVTEPGEPVDERGPGNQQIEGVRTRPRHPADETSVDRPRVGQGRGVVELLWCGGAHGLQDRRRFGSEQADHGEVGSLTRFGFGPEHHLLEERQQGGAGCGLGVDPRDTADIGLHEVMFDASVDIERQILRGCAVGKVFHALTGDGVEPGESFFAGDREDEAIRSVDDSGLCDGPALLSEGVAVMPGHAAIG